MMKKTVGPIFEHACEQGQLIASLIRKPFVGRRRLERIATRIEMRSLMKPRE
jgi:hypothetical protein